MAEKIRCAHILVEKLTDAQQILERLKKGEDFAKLAAEKSIDGSRRRGGDLGWFGRGMMVKEFENAAFTLQKGVTSQPIKTEFGWHLIKVINTR